MVYYTHFYQPANCFDREQNGTERGVDCDGSCVRVCQALVTPLNILWAKSFKIVEGQYNAVAYIENRNSNSGVPNLKYRLRLYAEDEIIAEREGETVIPASSISPIFEGRIATKDGKVPTKTEIEILDDSLWLPVQLGREQFKAPTHELLGVDSKPRLEVEIENVELTGAKDVEVVAVIFDQGGTPLTASRTFIDDFPGRSKKEIVFTWPNSIAKTVRSCEVESDIMLVLDRSGSMAADQSEPPEPLTSAKTSARTFLNLLRPKDQVGILSYATTPSSPLEQTLTNDVKQASEAIAKIAMGTNGVQYTDMGEAFAEAFKELKSSRHREDSRKVIVFLTDGDVTRPVNPATGKLDRLYASNYARTKAEEAKKADVIVYTIGFGKAFSTATSSNDVERDTSLIESLASDPSLYYTAPTVEELNQVYKKIASDICESGPTRIDILPKTKTNFAPWP